MPSLPSNASRGQGRPRGGSSALLALIGVLALAAPAAARKITTFADAALVGASVTDFEGLPPSYQTLDSFGLTAPGVAIAVSRPVNIGQMLSCVYGPTCELIAWTGSPVTLVFTPPVAAFAIMVNEATFCSYDVTITGGTGSENFNRSGGTQPCHFDEVIGAADIGPITQVVLQEQAGYKTHFDLMHLAVGEVAPVNADLGITKSAAVDRVGHGQPLGYAIAVANAGPDAAPGASVVDFLPPHSTYVDSTAGGSSAGGRVTWSLPGIAVGGSQACGVDITTPPFGQFSCSQKLVNIALVTPLGTEPVGNNVVVNVLPYDRAFAAPVETCSVDNGVDEDCDGLIDCGDPDCGVPGHCGFLALVDNPPPPVPPDPLPPGGEATCAAFGFFNEPITLPAICCGGEPCDACTNPSKAEWSFKCPPKDPNFKTSDPPVNGIRLTEDGHAAGGYGFVAAGQTIAYRITYENIGGSDAHGVQVIDALDANLDAATLIVENAGVFDAVTRTIVWTDPTVPPHTPRTVGFHIALRADATPGTRVRNVATVVFPDAVPPTRIDTNFTEHIVPDPSLRAVDLAVVGCIPAGPDTWQVQVVHRGYVPAYNVTATVLTAPDTVEVIQGTAQVFAHPSDGSNLHVAIPRAVNTSTDTVTLRSADGSDPCTRVRWSICHATPAGAQACLGELCDDCIDNDADGAVDYEDDECCAAPAALTLRKARLQPGATPSTGKLTLRGRAVTSFSPDPTSDGLLLQLRSETAEILCTRLPAAEWKRKGKKKPRYRRKAPGGSPGLTTVSLVPKAAGTDLSAGGRKVDLPGVAAGALTVTVGSGDRCAAATATLKRKKRAFVYP